MSQQEKPPLIVKISFSTALFDCGVYCNWQMNMYFTSTVKLNLVKFHSSTSTRLRVQHEHARPYNCWLTP